MDPCSFSNIDVFRTQSIHFDWNVDFENKAIKGHATLTCDLEKPATELIFDTRALKIDSVSIQECIELCKRAFSYSNKTLTFPYF